MQDHLLSKDEREAALLAAEATNEEDPTPTTTEPARAPDMAFLAERLVGLREVPGAGDDPLVVAMHKYGARSPWFKHDSVPWCSSAMCAIARLADRINPASAAARSWLAVGVPITVNAWLESVQEVRYNTVAVIRQSMSDPGPEVLQYRGHVFLMTDVQIDQDATFLVGLGGNQSNAFNLRRFDAQRLLGLRYLPRILP